MNMTPGPSLVSGKLLALAAHRERPLMYICACVYIYIYIYVYV